MADQIDIDQLITLVQARPCLWDKSDPSYKDRIHIKNGWTEVYSGLKEDFETLLDAEKKIFGAGVTKKWTNLRDSFRKYYRYITKPRSGTGATKSKYIYYEQLSFLTKVFEERPTEDSLRAEGAELTDDVSDEDSQVDVDEPDEVFPDTPQNSAASENAELTQNTSSSDKSETVVPNKKSATHLKNSKRKREREIEDELLKALKSPEEENPQLSFFKGILPALKNWDSDEIMDFQMEVMKLVQNFNARKRGQKQASSNTSSMYNSPPDSHGSTFAYNFHHPYPPTPYQQTRFCRSTTPNSFYAGSPPQISPDFHQMHFSRPVTPTSSRTPTPLPSHALGVSIPTPPDFTREVFTPPVNSYSSSSSSSTKSSSNGHNDDTQDIDPIGDSA